MAMVKVCNDYFMIDALAGGQVIRKRKYRRENTMIGYKWYDYNGVEVIDTIEISRLDSLATKHQRVDQAYDDHAVFMSSTNYVNSVSGIPMDKHMVVVEWRPESEQGFVTMAHEQGLEGDSYYIVVINTGDKQATIYTPVYPEEPKEDATRAEDDASVSVGGSYVSISPRQVERIRVTFRGGKWYYELVAKTYPSNTGGIKIGDVDFVTFRYLWDESSGRDLDTMTEALNSNVPTIDNLGVGFAGPGNNDDHVRSVLKWGGDNTGSGKECVWMSVKDLRAQYYDILPEETQFIAYSTWFRSKGTGKCSFELVGYKGGTMRQDGYNFINTGGSVVYQNTYDFICNTSKGASTYKTSYQKVARITYNKLTNEVYMSIGDAIDQEDNYDKLEREINNIKERFSDVELQSTYDKNYEIVNIVSGSRLQAINSDKDEIKFVNSTTGNVTVVFNATVSGGAKKLTSLLALNEMVLTPGAAASFTRTGETFTLSDLFGVTIFPDLADFNREGEWVMGVGVTGKPILMEVKEMRRWNESIVRELTIDELNEKFPNVDIGFAVVCKTINKVYEMVNGYKEWVSYDITSIN